MKIDPKKISNWIERNAAAYLAEDDRKTQARREKALKATRIYWLLLAGCGVMFLLGLLNHMNVAEIRAAGALAAIVVFFKLLQFTMIAIDGNGGRSE